MRRNSHGISRRLIVLATLLALTLTLLFGGIASASAVATSQKVSSSAKLCISATPLTQVVGVRQLAWVTVSVSCLPITALTQVQVKWGDGTIEYYPVVPCLEVCHIPPYTVDTSHAYLSAGAYHPVFCLIPSPSSAISYCTTTQILVVILDPPLS